MKYLPIVIGIAACLAVGELSSLLQSDALQSWYPQLDKSVLTPPGVVFAVVWVLLYILMGVSIGLVWKKRKAPDYKMVTGLFVGQLVLNFFWSVVFFFFHSPWAGMMVITGNGACSFPCFILTILVILSRLFVRKILLQEYVPNFHGKTTDTVFLFRIWEPFPPSPACRDASCCTRGFRKPVAS